MRLTDQITRDEAIPLRLLKRAVHHEPGSSLQNRSEDRKRLRINWVVTIDEDGTRRLGMNWRIDLENRFAADKVVSKSISGAGSACPQRRKRS
jgi:hypothetical protein